MPVVTNIVRDSAGQPVRNARVSIELVAGADSRKAGFVTGSTIGNARWITASSLGAWSVDLTANSLIAPSNTYYVVTEQVDDRQSRSYSIIVPNGAGPYQASSIIAVAHPGPDPLVPVYPTSVGNRFDQVSPASTWTIPFAGRVPAITLFVNNYVAIGDVEVNGSNLYVTFPAPTAGFAILV